MLSAPSMLSRSAGSVASLLAHSRVFLLLVGVAASLPATADELPVIGASARATEVQSGARFRARVDTGAASCSLHVEDYRINEPADSMHANVGKPIRLLVRDERGESHWIESKVADVAQVKNPSTRKHQQRYKVWLELSVGGEQGRVKVSITDRRHMQYPLLLGRNFLAGRFVIDPSRDEV